jgi:hypothetical protein
MFGKFSEFLMNFNFSFSKINNFLIVFAPLPAIED